MTLTGIDNIADPITRQRILKLHPDIRQLVVDAINAIEDRGVGIRITYGLRTFSEQDAIWQKGRDKDGKKIGPTVTNARGGQSYHNYGLAVDFCMLHKDGKASFNWKEDLDADSQADWMEAVEEFKKRGFEWGGEWDNPVDRPHVQWIPPAVREMAKQKQKKAWQILLELRKRSSNLDAGGYVVRYAA